MINLAQSIDKVLGSGLFPYPRFNNAFIDPSPWPEDLNYSIALIPMKIKYPDYFNIINKDSLKMLQIKRSFSTQVKDILLNTAKEALNEGAKIIVYNELSYPLLEDKILIKELKDCSKETNSIIIGGSFHEVRRKSKEEYGHNVCPIFNFSKKGIICQYKNNPGYFGGSIENIKSSGNFNVFHTRYGVFIVPICIDIMDGNLWENIKKLNSIKSLYHPIDLIIVPSYTDNPSELAGICSRVSYYSKTCVAYVNAAINNSPPNVFICGVELDADKIIAHKQSNYPSIYIYNIDIAGLRNDRLNSLDIDISNLKIEY
jgi:predicted amidohydrolase